MTILLLILISIGLFFVVKKFFFSKNAGKKAVPQITEDHKDYISLQTQFEKFINDAYLNIETFKSVEDLDKYVVTYAKPYVMLVTYDSTIATLRYRVGDYLKSKMN